MSQASHDIIIPMSAIIRNGLDIGLEQEARGADVRMLEHANRALFFLGDTALSEHLASWRGRRVRDSQGRAIGVIKDLLVEHRTLDEAARDTRATVGWGVRPRYALLNLAMGGLWPRRRCVLVPIWSFREDGRALRFSGDVHHLRTTVSRKRPAWLDSL